MSNASDFVIENGVLTKYIGPGGDVTIPEYVTEIASNAFYLCCEITRLVIPDSVTTIGANAFWACRSLKSVVLPKDLKVIPNSAFYDCTFLSHVTMPDAPIEIGSSAFSHCSHLRSIVLADTITKIGEAAFFHTDLQQVSIPCGISELSPLVFRQTALRKIHIPSTIKTIGAEAFYSTPLQRVTIDHGVTRLGENCFACCGGLEAIRLPESVTEIGKDAFYRCWSLKKFYAPGVECSGLPGSDIKALAIADFMADPQQYRNPNVVASYHKYLFTQKKKWLPVIFKADSVKLLSIFGDAKKITAANLDEEFLALATAANATECIAWLLDWKNRSLTGKPAKKASASSLDKDPYSVGEMKKLWLFQPLEDGTVEITCYKGSETEVYVPPRIGKAMVSRLSGMVFSPERDRRTSAQAVQMQNITSITIPATVTDIAPAFISGCNGLEQLLVEADNPIYHTSGNCLIETASKTLIAGCKMSVIPADGSVTVIGDQAFLRCRKLTALTIPGSVNHLGIQCFAYTGLTAVTIPSGVSLIPESCFDHCEELTEIQIPDSVTEIATCGIYACLKLKNIRIPSSVTKIGDFVFSKAVIHGAAGSYAETYAKENNKKFVIE